MTTPIDDFTPEEFDQFRYLIGCYLFQSPVACLLARHAKPLNTLSDYFDVLPDLDKVTKAARQFTVEFARLHTCRGAQEMKTKEFAELWHGPNPAAKGATENAAARPDLHDVDPGSERMAAARLAHAAKIERKRAKWRKAAWLWFHNAR